MKEIENLKDEMAAGVDVMTVQTTDCDRIAAKSYVG